MTDATLYLDAAATEPVSGNVIDAMLPFMTDAYANPASVHQDGKTAARALDAARRSFAGDLGAHADDVIFTSGGTESDNLAIKGIALAAMRRLPQGVRPCIVVSAVEHPAVAESARWMARFFDADVFTVPVDGRGRIRLDALEGALVAGDGAGSRPVLVSVMLANNEVGAIQPVEDVVRIAHRHHVPVHVDAVQAAGQVPIHMRDWDVDALSVSGHKFGTPKGLGALLVRGRVPIEPLLSGGGQERGLRSGTQNVAGAVGLAIALDESITFMREHHAELVASRDRLIRGVLEAIPQARLTGDPEHRLPGHASFIFPGVTGEALLVDLDARGIECSSGSACAIGRHEIPSTLLAMGLEPAVAKSALRLTFRRPLADADIARIIDALRASCESLGLH
ncbi:aminotransferase class V-fold PLP-dependent enzyme [Bifidobacterium sp. SMB2]|uniref:cysteine desulfurase n=1 Tax=Bifidobacterium saimiriisciurei TaxID=2661627 RepID=A0ABX0CBX5_9BIFI|nr:MULTISPECIES: cysteine desulfurase family protein [Bifidobacterium]NEG95917.1 aminotransferase class V-fold PLP-dependent enzyme [Bifidobacterium sp. SMB2]NEH11764.1 aminotransferase class V-fold PLP-dependent enzyme [Bifidobacterium saimiriisciurei]